MDASLVRKYDVPGPRYTSYPAVPHWSRSPDAGTWTGHVRRTYLASNARQGLSLYVHLPYCDSLCTYCGCNMRVTVNHAVEEPYIRSVLAEWRMYRDRLPGTPKVRELHLGGGTPTFFGPGNLRHLVEGLLEGCDLAPDADLGFEGHPRSTTAEHLRTMAALGFRRVSFGIQDFDPRVQEVINRIQPFEQVERAFADARAAGYGSINADLVYGLPLQTLDSIRDTIGKTLVLRPDRIALYGYAHVPWVKPGQRRYSEADLPQGEERRALYDLGKDLLLGGGYHEVGMDHFALPHDALCAAMECGTLHRNFMGYTPVRTDLTIGLGVSSISDAWTCFAQNLKVVEDYQAAVARGELPLMRGHIVDPEDLPVRAAILDLMCRFTTDLAPLGWNAVRVAERYADLVADGLVATNGTVLRVTEAGRPFVRNVCMAIDRHLAQSTASGPVFSRTV